MVHIYIDTFREEAKVQQRERDRSINYGSTGFALGLPPVLSIFELMDNTFCRPHFYSP